MPVLNHVTHTQDCDGLTTSLPDSTSWWISRESDYGFGIWDSNNGVQDQGLARPSSIDTDLDPTQWMTWKVDFSVSNDCVYLDLWSVNGVDTPGYGSKASTPNEVLAQQTPYRVSLTP